MCIPVVLRSSLQLGLSASLPLLECPRLTSWPSNHHELPKKLISNRVPVITLTQIVCMRSPNPGRQSTSTVHSIYCCLTNQATEASSECRSWCVCTADNTERQWHAIQVHVHVRCRTSFVPSCRCCSLPDSALPEAGSHSGSTDCVSDFVTAGLFCLLSVCHWICLVDGMARNINLCQKLPC